MSNQRNDYPLNGYNQQEMQASNMQYNGYQQYDMNTNPKHSGLGIVSFVLALLGCTAVFGLILGIVDFAINKRNKHSLSVAAIIISLLWLICGFGIMSIGIISSNTDTISSKSIESSVNTTVNDTDTATEIEAPKQVKKQDKTIYSIGDTINIKSSNGEYNLCITGVTETSDRNEFSDIQADRVIIIDYMYENIEYNVEFGDYQNNELSISDWDFSMYDADGNILETYPADTKYAKAVSPGHKSSGQMAFALNNDTNYIEAEYHDNMFAGSDFTIELIW